MPKLNNWHAGGYDGNSGSWNKVLAWKDEDWEEVGRMRMARYTHAISLIKLDDDAMEYCE